LCSLDDFYKEKRRQNLKYTANDLKYIFAHAIKMVLLLREKGFVHNDIKTQNICFVIARDQVEEEQT
jgi:hypothetical protein